VPDLPEISTPVFDDQDPIAVANKVAQSLIEYTAMLSRLEDRMKQQDQKLVHERNYRIRTTLSMIVVILILAGAIISNRVEARETADQAKSFVHTEAINNCENGNNTRTALLGLVHYLSSDSSTEQDTPGFKTFVMYADQEFAIRKCAAYVAQNAQQK
jgi:hypothetical protein